MAGKKEITYDGRRNEMTEHKFQKKFDDCVAVLEEIRDTLAMTFSANEVDDRILAMDPLQLIGETIRCIDEVQRLPDDVLREVSEGLNKPVDEQRKDVVVLISENDTKDILQ